MHRENEVDEANKLTSNSLEKNKKNTATTRNDLKEQWTKKRSQDRRECLGLFFWPWRPYFIAFLNRLVFPVISLALNRAGGLFSGAAAAAESIGPEAPIPNSGFFVPHKPPA